MEQIYDLSLKDIWADPEFNSRGHFTPASVATLADEIERQGLLQPIIVQRLANEKLGTQFKVVIGHRRTAAHHLLAHRDPKWSTIKARVVDALPEDEALAMNIMENLEREPLNMLREAIAISRFKKWGWPAKRVAEKLGQTKKWVEVRWGLLTLPEDIQRRAETGYLSQYQVEACMDLPTSEEQYQYVKRIVDHREKLKVIPTEEQVARVRTKKTIDVFAKGQVRTPAEIFLLQESIQDSFDDVRHPAAVALAWAAGVLNYEEFCKHIRQWAADAGLEYKPHAEVVRRESA